LTKTGENDIKSSDFFSPRDWFFNITAFIGGKKENKGVINKDTG
jgi:hypothetical protein